MISVEARGIRISVQHFPDRKRPSLCVEYFSKPAEIYVVGSFNSEENAARFKAAIKDMFEKKEGGLTMKATGGDLFFEVFGIIAFFAVIIALIFYLWYLFTEIIPEFRNDYKSFKDLVHQRLHALDSRVRELEDNQKR